MKTIWIVERASDYEGSDFWGAFSTRKKAVSFLLSETKTKAKIPEEGDIVLCQRGGSVDVTEVELQ